MFSRDQHKRAVNYRFLQCTAEERLRDGLMEKKEHYLEASTENLSTISSFNLSFNNLLPTHSLTFEEV